MTNQQMANQRVVWPEEGVARVEVCDMPAPAPDQLLIRTRVSLVSPGTERAFFLGLPNTSQRYPQYPGYSVVGEVAAVGEAVTGWQAGQRLVCAAPHAAFVTVAAERCAPVPEELPDEKAAFFNLASIALQGVRKARVELGEPVAVLGAGLIGLLAAQLAQLSGGLPILSIDRDERRLDFARQVGVDAALPANGDLSAAVAEHCNGPGAAVVIEATGSPPAVPTAFALAVPGGRVVLLGSTRGETAQVNFYRDVHKKGLSVIGAHDIVRPAHESSPGFWTKADDYRVVLKLLAWQRLTIQPLITHRFAWQQAPQAYESLRQWESSALGMVLDWRQTA